MSFLRLLITTSVLLLGTSRPLDAQIISGRIENIPDSSSFDFGTGKIRWSAANVQAGYFYGQDYLAPLEPTVYFGDIKFPGFWPYYNSYEGLSSITEFTSAADHAFTAESHVAFGTKEQSPSVDYYFYQGILLFKQNGFFGGIDPIRITSTGELTIDYWYDASGLSDFSLAPTVVNSPVPEPGTYGLLGAVALVGLIASRRSKSRG